MSRIEKVRKNIAISYLSQIVTALAAFVCRTIFIRQLDAAYLGVNGLFTNILGILSLAELGFGTAMNFEMYKPVVEKDYSKITALLMLYKRVYHGVAVFIIIGGFAFVPFLSVLVKDPGDIGNIYVYYALYILNTAAGYYASYLLCLTNAEQDEYISSLFSMGHTLLANILELTVLLVFKSFYLYLFVWFLSTIIQQVAIKLFFKNKYKYVFTESAGTLDTNTKNHIRKNMGGLIISKMSEVLLLQTDNIIIALGMNIITVGYADNYYLIISYLKKIILSLLKSVIPSLGNMVVTEDREKGYEVFKIYDLVDYLIYSLITICLIVMFQPFMMLWVGKDKVVDNWSVLLLCISFYISGRNQGFMNYKTAHGIFYDIKITCIVSVLLNIIISVVGVFRFGLIGVYLGTCVSELYANIRNLRLSYKSITGRSVWQYYRKRVFQAAILIGPILLLHYISIFIRPYEGWLHLLLFGLLSLIISFFWMLILFGRSDEYRYLRNLFLNEIKKVTKRGC